MNSTMHAAVVEALGEPLVLPKIPIPTPAAGKILDGEAPPAARAASVRSFTVAPAGVAVGSR